MNNEHLENFLTKSTAEFSYGEALKKLILATANASIELARLLAKGSPTGEAAKLDSLNVQGEYQMQLDVISNDIYVNAIE